MISLFNVLQFINPLVSLNTVNVGSPNGYEKIISWDISIGPQPTQVQIDVARPGAEMAIAKMLLEQAVQSHLDASARVKGYNSILSACTYDNSSNAVFRAEGMKAVAWRDAVWTYCYEVLAAVTAGTRQVPTEAELIAELKLQVPLVW